MNHLFRKDENISTLFPFIQKVEHLKCISVSLFLPEFISVWFQELLLIVGFTF